MSDNGEIHIRQRDRRMISRRGVTQGKRINSVSFEARWLWVCLNASPDDEGRQDGDPFDVKVNVVPAVEWSLDKISELLGELAEANLILWYEVKSRRYIQMVDWDIHQRFHGIKKYLSGLPTPPVTTESGVPTTPDLEEMENVRDKQEEIRDKKDIMSSPEDDDFSDLSDTNPSFGEDSEPFQMALYFRDFLHRSFPDMKLPPATTRGLATWSADIDKLLRLDKRDIFDTKNTIAWMHTKEEPSGKDGFRWRDVVLSPKKLRKQYDQIRIKMDKPAQTGKQKHIKPLPADDPSWKEEMDKWPQ